MDSAVHSALEEICCSASNGLYLHNLWQRLGPQLASQGLPLCPNVKRAMWENLLQIPGLKVEAYDGRVLLGDFVKYTVEECEEMNVKIMAPESMRKSFLGIYEMEAPESGLSDIQRLILERLAVARTNGIPQSELSKELHIAPNKIFYPLKKLETQGYIVRHPTVIRSKQASNREPNSESVTATNMLYLYRYGKLLGFHQRLEIIREDKFVMDKEIEDDHTETGTDFAEDIAKEDVHVKDFLPALKAICDKLDNAKGKVLIVSDIKQDLGYRGPHGHRAWRNICHKLKVAQVVEECCTVINEKEVNCLRLIRNFSASYFEPKHRGRVFDDMDPEQSINSLERGQVTEQVLELPILRQVYDMVDAAGAKGLTNIEVCGRLGLCSKEYHRRYFKQMISRFGLHLQLEPHNRNEVYRLWTAGNFNKELFNMTSVEGETFLKEANESAPRGVDLNIHEDMSQPVNLIDDSTSMGNVIGINESENGAVVTAEASNGANMDNECSNTLLLQYSLQNSDVELSSGVPDNELYMACDSVNNKTMAVTHSLAVVSRTPPTPRPSRRRSNSGYPHLITGVTNSQREQHILKMLQEEKFLIKPELHRRLESLENIGKEKKTTMDRKTLLRCLNKLQGEGHCKCIHVSVPDVTNYGRSRATEVILHSSFQNVSPEILTQIHDRIRSFEIQVRKKANIRQKDQSVPVLDNVERIPSTARSDTQALRAEAMRNGFVLPKMIRTKLLHIFLWDWMHSSPGWDAALLSSNHSYDMKNPHSTCKMFELDLAIRSMPLALFLKVVGSAQALEDMVGKCRSGVLLCDLPVEEYKIFMDTRATGRLSWLIDILRRLKLIRLVNKDHAEDEASKPHTTLTHALELKPYIEEPATSIASTGLGLHDLRPQIRHDFVLLSRTAVAEYWNTLEYCYSASKSRAALLAFPGTAVHEVFHPRSWTCSRDMTAGERIELDKRVRTDDPNENLSFSDCEEIAKDLNLSLEQVLRVYSEKRQQRLTKLQRDLAAKNQMAGAVKSKQNLSSSRSKRSASRMPSKLVKANIAVEESSLMRLSPIYDADGKTGGSDAPNLTEDKEVYTFICKQALAKLNMTHQNTKNKYFWTEEADRKLVIEYARYRAALGAKFHRVDWASVPSLPAPPNTCKRRMAVLNSYMPFRKAVMKLCNILAEHYSKYLEERQDRMLDHGDFIKTASDPALGETQLKFSATMSRKWDNFDDDVIKSTLNDVLRHKSMAKLESPQDALQDQEHSEDDDNEGCEMPSASGKRSNFGNLPVNSMRLSNDFGSVCRQMHESVAVANAAELFKLIFLSDSKSPEVPILLAETLRRYSEHDLFAAFNYLREKKIMIGGSSNTPFVLSQHFLQSISLSPFPNDTGKRASDFLTWLHEKEKDLVVGIDVPSDLQCGEVFTLCALISSGGLSIAPCLPNEGVGETEDNRTPKRKCDDNEADRGQTPKKLKTIFTGEGETVTRREKGFPGIKLCLQRESFKVEDVHQAPLFGEKDQGIQMNANCGASISDAVDYEREMFDSVRTTHRALDVGGSPWESMSRYAEYLMPSYSNEGESSIVNPDLFKNLYSAIHKSGDNGVSMKDVRKILNMEDDKMVEVIVEVLEAFGRALKVNGYDSIRVVDSLYQSKYFLGSVRGYVDIGVQRQKRKFEDEHMHFNNDNQETFSTLENGNNTTTQEEHRVTILSLPEDVFGSCADVSPKDKNMSYHNSDSASSENRAENFRSHSVDTQLCRPVLPWMNGDGTVNELVYKGVVRRVLGIVMQNPGILEDGIIKQMQGLNPQSCRRLLEMMILDNHIITRTLQQRTSSQPPSILENLIGCRFRKSKLVSRAHYFANPMSTASL